MHGCADKPDDKGIIYVREDVAERERLEIAQKLAEAVKEAYRLNELINTRCIDPWQRGAGRRSAGSPKPSTRGSTPRRRAITDKDEKWLS